ncbi:MAG TPA: pyridoxamine 5'-phosphate oxidase family protein, partial [Acidimicrobiales bacterium]
MRGSDSRIGIEAMDRQECFKRLRVNKLGRVAVVIEGHPVLSPINYAVTDELIVFRIAKGSK